MAKLPLLQETPTFEEKEQWLTLNSFEALRKQPLKGLKQLPHMVGIAKEDRKWLKLKALKYMFLEDKGLHITKGVLRRPFSSTIRYLLSFVKRQPFKREGDLFFYGVKGLSDFQKKAKNSPLVIGFSYCQKPHECPSGRFNDNCLRDLNHPVCAQCDIGKISALLPEKSTLLLIPTVHHIGRYFFERLPEKPLFIITACEMTLQMFADFGNMLSLQGIGLRLDGRICNTMKAFELSERGIKPGLTVLTKSTYQQVVALLKRLHKDAS